MKKIMHIVMVLGLWCLLGAAVSAEEQAAANLVQNPGFEEGDDMPANWQIVKKGSATELNLDKQNFHSGGKALFMRVPAPSDEEVFQEFPVEGGKTYVLSCWVKTENYEGNGHLAIPCYYATPGEPTYDKDWIMVLADLWYGTKNWGKFETKVEVPQPVKKLKLRIISQGMQGKLWIDDIYFGLPGGERQDTNSVSKKGTTNSVEIETSANNPEKKPRLSNTQEKSVPRELVPEVRSNLCENYSAEEVVDAKPAKWRFQDMGASPVEYGLADEGHTGKKSVQLRVQNVENGKKVRAILIADDCTEMDYRNAAPALPSTEYFYSFWMKGDLREVEIEPLAWSPDGGRQYMRASLKKAAPTSIWKKYEGTFFTCPTTTYAKGNWRDMPTGRIALAFWLLGEKEQGFAPGQVLIDDVYLSARQAEDSTLVKGCMDPPRVSNREVPDNSFGYFASDNYSGVIYLSPDMPSLCSFVQVSTLKSTVENMRLIMDLPVEIQILGGRKIAQIKESFIYRGDWPCRRYEIKINKPPSQSDYTTTMLISTSLAQGQQARGYYHAEWEGGRQPEKELLLESISIPRIKPPERLFTEICLPADLIALFPDLSEIRETGFKTISMTCYDFFREGWGIALVESAVNKAKAAGLQPGVWIGDYPEFAKIASGKDPAKYEEIGTLYHPQKQFVKWDTQDAMAMDLNGKQLATVCPSYRGQFFKKLVDHGKFLVDLGVFYHFIDPEYYENMGQRVCFCPRCRDLFKVLLKQKHSDLAFLDPSEFEKKPAEHGKLHEAWVDFKTSIFADMYAEYRKLIEEYMKQKGLKEKLLLQVYLQTGYGPKHVQEPAKSPNFEKYLEDPRKWADVCNYLGISNYLDWYLDYDMWALRTEDEAFIDLVNNYKTDVISVLSAGFIFNPLNNGDITPDLMMKYQIYEVLAAGCKGIYLYGFTAVDALDMKSIAEALRAVTPAEDVVIDGKADPRFKCQSDNAFVKALTSDKGSFVLVSEYSTRPLEITVSCPGHSGVVLDLETRAIVPQLSTADSFKVRLEDQRARVFFVGDIKKLALY